jgi:subtilase family serine protease
VTLEGNLHPFTQPRFDRGPAPASSQTGRILLVLRRSVDKQQALSQYLSDLQNPASPGYHKWLTPAQFGAQYGTETSDIQKVESWLRSRGFRIDGVPTSRNIMAFSGTIEQVQNTFHTSIHSLVIDGKTRFANFTNPQIPVALAPVIAGVGPLNNLRAQPNLKIGATGNWDSTTRSIQPSLTLFGNGNMPFLFVDPADAATIYDAPNSALNPGYTTGTSYTGSGATIGIAGVSNINLPDIQNYRTGFLGESAATVNLPTVIIDGNDPGLVPNGDGLEALLDNEVAGGLAPGAKIDFYTSAGSDLSDGLFNAITRAVDDNAIDILNISFGECEAALGTSGNQLVLELAEQAAAQGISVTVSSGDGGSAGCDNFDTATTAHEGLAVNGFASSPYTVAVGGTDFDTLASSFSTYVNSASSGTAPYYLTAKGYIPEKPWNDSTTVNTTISQNVPYTDNKGNTNIIAGSGGVSTLYSKPAFQTSLTPADSHRDLPDIALFAGNGFYSAVWTVCSDSVVNGTGATPPVSDCANSGGQFGSNTSFTGVGGTSAAAPAFAGMLALVVQKTGGRLGQADAVLYQLVQKHPSYFHDITSGNNSVPCSAGSPGCSTTGFLTGYEASAGYDLASGLGSVDAAAIVNSWASVSLGSTSTALQINGSAAAYTGVHGASLAFNASVSGSGGTPTGVVAIKDNANLTAGGVNAGAQNDGQFAIPLANGSGSANYNGLPGGTYAVTASYGGDASYAASTSAPIAVTINPEPSTTTLAVNAYDSSTGKPISTANIPYGSFVFADAGVMGTAEGSKTQGLATGTIEFMNGSTLLGTSTVDSGNQASWPALTGAFTALSGGSYNLTAQYSGDPSFNPSTSTSVPFTIVPATTNVAAQSTLYNMVAGDSATIIVFVNASSNGGVPPTGTVILTANGKILVTPTTLIPSGFSPFADPVIQASQLSPGLNLITVKYSGDSNYSGSSTTLQIDYAGNGGFSISTIPPVALSPNSTVITSMTLVPSSGFVGSVEFSSDVTGAIAGSVTCTVLPAYMTGPGPTSATIIIAADSSAAGTYTVVVSGESGNNARIKATSTFTVTVGPNSTPSIDIFSNGNLSVSPGSSVGNSSSVTIIPSVGLAGQLNLACSVSTSLSNAVSPPTCSVPASVTVTPMQASIIPVNVVTSATTTTGDYTVIVTATDAAAPSIKGSSTADLTVASSPLFALAGTGPARYVPGTTTGNTTTVTATPVNGYGGTVNLTCIVTALSPNLGSLLVYPICSIPASVSISGNSITSFTLTLSGTGNPAYPTPGIYLATVSGYDTALTNITSQTAIVVMVGTPGLALSSSGNITVSRGATTGNTSTISVAPIGGFTGAVNLSCSVTTSFSNPNDPPTCSVPSSVNISGTTAATATLTVNTTAATSANLNRPLDRFVLGGGGSLLAALILFGIPTRRRAWSSIVVIVAFVLIAAAIGCGGGGSGSGTGGGGSSNVGTTAGSYTITVTGTDMATGKVTANTVVTLLVN